MMRSMLRQAAGLPTSLVVAVILASCGGAESTTEDDAEMGAPLAEESEEEEESEGSLVTLGEVAFRTAGIETLPAETRNVALGAVAEILPGQVEFDPSRVALISPRSGGRIERLTVVEGESVDQGEIVGYLLSTEFLTARSDYVQAARRAEVLQGTPRADDGQAFVEAAARRLSLLGVEPEWLEEDSADDSLADLLPLRSPMTGRIVEAHALTGAAVEPGSPIFTVADLSVVDVAVRVPERSLANLRVGQELDVTLAAYPGQEWTGRVQRLRDELDRETRTLTALVRVPNPDRTLRPGMFASVRLGTPPNAAMRSGTVVPGAAIVTDGSERYAFVEVDVRTYERRSVEIEALPGEEGWWVVLAGVEAGELVVVNGAFTLKAELAKGGFGDVD